MRDESARFQPRGVSGGIGLNSGHEHALEIRRIVLQSNPSGRIVDGQTSPGCVPRIRFDDPLVVMNGPSPLSERDPRASVTKRVVLCSASAMSLASVSSL